MYWIASLFLTIVFMVCLKLFKFKEIHWWESLAQLTVGMLVASVLWLIAANSMYWDSYIVTGQVTKKYSDEVSCEHSYSCRCRQSCSGSGSNRSCYTVCDTCYEHSYDMDWVVESTVGNTTIDRISRRGLEEPPRWTKVKIGEPFSDYVSYSNYIKGTPTTVFKTKQTKAVSSMPEVYDYYRYSPIIGGTKEQTEYLEELLIKSKYNVILYVTTDPNLYSSVEASWVGGDINTVVGVLTVKNSVIEKADFFTYGRSIKNALMVQEFRLDLLNTKFDNATIKMIVDKVNKSYVPVSNEEFEYLKKNVQFSVAGFIFLLILQGLAQVAMAFLFINNETKCSFSPKQTKTNPYLPHIRKIK